MMISETIFSDTILYIFLLDFNFKMIWCLNSLCIEFKYDSFFGVVKINQLIHFTDRSMIIINLGATEL